MRRGPISTLCLASLLVAVSASAALGGEPKVDAKFDRARGRVGDPVTLSVSVEGGDVKGQPEIDPSNDYHAYFQGQSRNFSFVNGRFSSSTVYTFRVVPQKEGKIAVGPIRLRIDDAAYEVAPLELIVESISAAPPQPQPSAPQQEQREPDDGGLFITTDVDRDTVYLNQQVTLTFRFYQSLDAFVLGQPSYTPPSTTGFLKQELGDQRQYTIRRTGRVYKVTEIQTALFPTRTGRLRIGEAGLECMVEGRSRRTRDPFSIFRNGIFGDRKVTLRSKPLEVQVLPLPQRGRPADFEGAVGSFKLTVDADTTAVRANEPVTIRAKITGAGSVTTLGSLELATPEGVRFFDSGQEAHSHVRNGKVLAEKLTTWILVPTSPRPLRIPSLSLSYFDPERGRYLRTESDPLSVEVLPGDAPDLVTLGGTPPAVVGRDIRYLKTEMEGLRWGETAGPLGPIPWIHAFPLLVLAGALILHTRRQRLSSDAVAARRSSAHRRARARLRTPGKIHPPERIAEVVESYLADRIGDPTPGATRAQLLEEVSFQGVKASLLEETRIFLEDCDAQAFTPEGGAGGDESLAGQAGALLDRLEEGFRKA